MNQIRLYVGDWYRVEYMSHIPLLFPFWGPVLRDTLPYMKNAIAQHRYSGEDFVLVENIADADFVVVPHPYERYKRNHPDKLDRIKAEARVAHKMILIDASGDIEHPIVDDDTVVLRQSQYRYGQRPNEIAIPLPAEDLLETYYQGNLVVRHKHGRPSVSFTGWAELPFLQHVKTKIKEFPKRVRALFFPERAAEQKGVFLRQRALKILASNPQIDAHFLIRNSYSGHTQTLRGSIEENRKQFVANIFDADYSLCVRGDGNSSIRFYEALSLGRIPLLLDTACVLPLEEKIDYKKFCVIVDHAELSRIDEKLIAFHESCSPEKFEQMQKMARDTFQTYLRNDVFYYHLAEKLRSFLIGHP